MDRFKLTRIVSYCIVDWLIFLHYDYFLQEKHDCANLVNVKSVLQNYEQFQTDFLYNLYILLTLFKMP